MDFKNVDEILLSFAQYVIDASKENLKNDVNKYGSNKAGGDLDNSVSYTFDKSQNQFSFPIRFSNGRLRCFCR